MTQTTSPAAVREDPLRFGVGARVTICVMADRYAEFILGALQDTDLSGLEVRTGDVSTWLGGDEKSLLRGLTDLTSAVAATGNHASISLMLSRGCPGEAVCEAPGGAGPRAVPIPAGRRTGQFASAEWSLYPLADVAPTADDAPDAGTGAAGTGTAGSGTAPPSGHRPDHMRDIYAAIDHARSCGIEVSTEHYATRLAGDLGLILETVVAAWVLTGQSIQHVTTHLTISVNSPSHPGVQA